MIKADTGRAKCVERSRGDLLESLHLFIPKEAGFRVKLLPQLAELFLMPGFRFWSRIPIKTHMRG